MASISKVSGKSYRICTDAENDAYDELSFKTDAGDVSFTDGTDVETNLSAIKGITSDMSCEDENIAISAKAVNDSLECLIKTEIFEGTSVAIASGFGGSAITSKIYITIPEGYTIGSITPIIRDGAINASVVSYNETTGLISLGYINRYNSSVTIKPQVLILFVKS